jgi:hypothetical protein
MRLRATRLNSIAHGSRRGAAAAWTPAALGAALALWLDAADASTITLNGSTVSQWRDKSGNNRHASQATKANQPTYTPSGLNGKPVITFDGVDDFLSTTSFLLGQTAVSVARRSLTSEPVVEAQASLNRGFWGSAYPDFTTHTNYGVNGSALSAAAPNMAVGAASIVSQTGLLAGAASWRLGFGFPGYTPLNGFIAEIVTTDTLLSTTDRQLLEGYLAWKWGLEASLPAGHPFRNTPPTV